MDINEQTRVVYICGKCGKDVQLEAKDPIKCTFCGHRILNKKRKVDLKNPPQYEAI